MLVSNLIEGIAAALGCVVVTVIGIWCILSLQLARWYVPISWLMIGLSACTLAGIAVVEGWVAATSFTTTYILLSVIQLLIRFNVVGTDALIALVFSSMVLTIELVCIITLSVFSFKV
jgi:hypothetical protein